MDARVWLDQVRSECLRQNLPPLYVERLVSELSDHLFDFMEDSMSTDAKEFSYATSRLGMPGEIATLAAREYRQQRFSGRHPLLTFVLSPIVTLLMLWAAPIACSILAAKALGIDSSADLSPAANSMMPLVAMGYVLAPIAVAAAFYCRLATKAAVSWKWTLATCVILALIGGTAFASVTLPTAVSKGTIMFGFGVGLRPRPQQWLQFALPLSIGCWAIYRQMSPGRKAFVN